MPPYTLLERISSRHAHILNDQKINPSQKLEYEGLMWQKGVNDE